VTPGTPWTLSPDRCFAADPTRRAVAPRETATEAVMATAITSREVRMGSYTPKPCATNFAPTKTRITARP
jgi:hypothetical protein